MVSEKQMQANQLNAKAGGVKTPEGKAITSSNALKHGATSVRLLLPGDDQNEFDALAIQMRTHFLPQTSFEEILVLRITSLTWRLWRCEKAERGLLVRQYYTLRENEARAMAARFTRVDDFYESLRNDGKTTTILNKAGHERAENEANEMKQLQTGEQAAPGVSFHAEQEGLLNVSRYETGIERSLFRTLHELERVQSIRKGLPVPPPVVVTVDGAAETEPSRRTE